jgi:hypothetical protein
MAGFIEVDVPGYDEPIEFPDSMSDADIEAAIKLNFSGTSPSVDENELQSLGFLDQQKQDLKNIAGGGEAALHGAKRFVAGVGQLISPAIDALNPALKEATGRSTGDALKEYMQGRESDFQGKYGDSFPHKATAFATEMIPAFMGGAGIKAAQAPKFLMDMVKGATPLARGLTSAGGIFGKNAALAGAYAPIGYDESFENTGLSGGAQKAIDAAPIGGAVGAGIAGLTRLPQLPAKMLASQGGLTSSQAKDILPKLKGLSTGLGDAIEAPGIKSFEDAWLTKVPFAGVKKQQYDTGKVLEKEGEDILNRLAPSYNTDEGTVNVGNILKNSLNDMDKAVNKQKRVLYSEVDKIAEKSGINIEPDNYKKAASDILDDLKNSRQFGSLENSEKSNLESFLKSIFLKKGGRLKSANLKISDLNESKMKESMVGNKFLAGAYSRLAKGLKSDLERTVEKSGNKELKSSYDKAQKYYSENVAPFNEPEIAKFTRKNADSDTLVDYFLKSGKQDRVNLLDKLTSKLSGEEKNLLGREYLNSAMSVNKNNQVYLDPKKMVRMYNKLGSKTKNALFSDKDFKKAMEKYSVRVNKNPSATEALQVVPTGFSVPEYAGMSGLIGSLLTGNLPAAASIVGTGAAANKLSKYLRSDSARDLYLKALQPMGTPGAISGGLTGIGSVGASQ